MEISKIRGGEMREKKVGEWEKESSIHADDMADCVIGDGAITGDGIFESLLRVRRSPPFFSTAWIYVEVPVFLPQCLCYIFQILNWTPPKKNSLNNTKHYWKLKTQQNITFIVWKCCCKFITWKTRSKKDWS